MVVVEDFFGVGGKQKSIFLLALWLPIIPDCTLLRRRCFPPKCNDAVLFAFTSVASGLFFSSGRGKQGVWGVKSLHMCPLGREMRAVWRWGGIRGLASVLCIVFEVPCGVGWRLAKRDRTGPIFGSDFIL